MDDGTPTAAAPKEHWFWKVGDFAAKALIPIAIAYFTWSQGNTAEKDRIQSEAVQTDFKTLDLVVPLVSDKDPAKKQFGLSLASSLRPDLAARLYNALQTDPQSSIELKQKAGSALSNLGPTLLADYTIDIFVLDSDPQNQKVAEDMKAFIQGSVPSTQVRVKIKPASFYDSVAAPRENEVRFSGARQAAAESLVATLNAWRPGLNFTTRVTVSTYSNYLTVFLKSGHAVEVGS
jgi:hypothetical protein